MMKLIASIGFLFFVNGQATGKLQKYHAVEAYEIRPGVIVNPIYSANHTVCELSIERRHYSNNVVDMDALMSKEQIMSIFDELVSREERGGPGWKLPPAPKSLRAMVEWSQRSSSIKT